jgi:hypothetical protein
VEATLFLSIMNRDVRPEDRFFPKLCGSHFFFHILARRNEKESKLMRSFFPFFFFTFPAFRQNETT